MNYGGGKKTKIWITSSLALWWILYSDWRTSPGANLSQLPWPVPFVPMADTVGWAAPCQMGGPAAVQARHGLIFVWPTSSLPLALLPCTHTQTHEIRMESGGGGQRYRHPDAAPTQLGWCAEADGGWRPEGEKGRVHPIQTDHSVFTNTSCLLFYLCPYPPTVKLIYRRITGHFRATSAVCVCVWIPKRSINKA